MGDKPFVNVRSFLIHPNGDCIAAHVAGISLKHCALQLRFDCGIQAWLKMAFMEMEFATAGVHFEECILES